MTAVAFLPPERFVGFMLAGVLGDARCGALIGELAGRGFAPTGAAYPRNYRDNDRLVFDDPALAAQLFAQVGAALPATLVVDGVTWRLHGLNPRFRACRYRDGQAFCIHRDGPQLPDDRTRSLLTLQLYLDDADGMVGGRTRFYADRDGREPWAAIAPRRGAAIVFDHRVWHDGEAVTAGEKHVLRTDVMYRTDRPAAVERDDAVIGRHLGYAWRAIACRDGSIASGGRDGVVRRTALDPATPIGAHELGAGSVTALVETADRRLWCGTRAGAVVVLDGAQPSRVYSGGGAVLSAAALPDGGVVVSTALGELVALDGRAPPRITRVHDGWAWAVAVRRGVVSCGDDGLVIEDGRRLAALGHPLRALAVLPSGALLVGAIDGTIHRLDGGAAASWCAHGAAVTSLAVAPDGDWASSSEDGTVKWWRGDRLVRSIPARGDFVTSVAFGAGAHLIATGYDGAVWRVVD